ncbi:MAG: NAD-dependent epimerase/dehydratase family protein [Patescibacteria group bacterium]|jgi:GDP-L-fucose synthase
MSLKTTVFLAGGSGFIGKNILEQLGDKYNIIAPDRAELNLLDSEAVLDFFKKNPVDIVVNSAAEGVYIKNRIDPMITLNNLKIFYNLVRAKKYFNRMVMLGSGAEYDKKQNLKKTSENDFDRTVPADEYGLYKYICAKFAGEVDYITHLRLFGVFGKYENYEIRFISNAICKVLFNLPITIRQDVKFDYIFIDDFVKILDQIIKKKPVEKFINIGRGEDVSLKTLAEMIIKEVGVKVPIKISEPGLGNEYSCNNSRLLNEMEMIDFTPFSVSISNLVEYYRKILPTLNKKSFIDYER